MEPITEEEIVDLLAQTGRVMSPSPARFASTLRGTAPMGQGSTLLTISTYMSSTKIGVALVALVVVLGGGYYLMAPRGTEVALETSPTNTAAMTAETNTTVAAKTAAPVASSPTAATGSFDDFAAALQADAAAQASAVQSADQSANAAVTSSNTVTSSAQPYDPSTL